MERVSWFPRPPKGEGPGAPNFIVCISDSGMWGLRAGICPVDLTHCTPAGLGFVLSHSSPMRLWMNGARRAFGSFITGPPANAERHPSGAKARQHVCANCGTTEVVPFLWSCLGDALSARYKAQSFDGIHRRDWGRALSKPGFHRMLLTDKSRLPTQAANRAGDTGVEWAEGAGLGAWRRSCARRVGVCRVPVARRVVRNAAKTFFSRGWRHPGRLFRPTG